MKRDFDLIRVILRDVETNDPLTTYSDFEYDGYDKAVVAEHIDLLIEAGLLDGEVKKTHGGGAMVMVSRLTWAGHDFLASMADETIWAKAKTSVIKPLGGVAFDVLLAWLKAKGREAVGLPPT